MRFATFIIGLEISSRSPERNPPESGSRIVVVFYAFDVFNEYLAPFLLNGGKCKGKGGGSSVESFSVNEKPHSRIVCFPLFASKASQHLGVAFEEACDRTLFNAQFPWRRLKWFSSRNKLFL